MELLSVDKNYEWHMVHAHSLEESVPLNNRGIHTALNVRVFIVGEGVQIAIHQFF